MTTKGYVCKNCGHASGYHIDRGDTYGKCRIISCKCNCFEWSKEDYEKYERKYFKKTGEENEM